MKSPHHYCVPAGKARIGSARPALLRYPVIGVSVLLAFCTPSDASARTERGYSVVTASRMTHRQLRTVHAYERYLARIAAQKVAARRAVRFAYRQMGKPYRWGGAGPGSYDCSGLAMAAWRKGGVNLPHRADIQYHTIRRKVPMRSLRPGDLVFFSGMGHVGIYVGRGRFVHAPHTGTVIQRGSLTGWRRRAFAGAARPGAPAYRVWPRWVRALAGHPPRQVAGSVSVPAWSVDGAVSIPRQRAAAGGSTSVPERSAGSEAAPGTPVSGPSGPVGVSAAMTAPTPDGLQVPPSDSAPTVQGGAS
ncbi:MAG: NlpC/P60 family protein [Actinoallomurus sp.]